MIIKQSIVILLCGLSLSMSAQAKNASSLSYLQRVQSDILQLHSSQASKKLSALEIDLKAYRSAKKPAQLEAIKQNFKSILIQWKAMEALFIAGSIDEDLSDHPRYIDHFHQGHVSVKTILDKILSAETPLANAMFKNSSKGFNALEYLLFAEDLKQSEKWRHIDAALISVKHIAAIVDEINEFYKADKTFITAGKQSIGLVMNALVESSYKLKHWRLGEPGGLVTKNKGKTSVNLLEYHYSAQSLAAIVAILKVHKKTMSLGFESGFFESGQYAKATEELLFVQKQIELALAAAQEMPSGLAQQITKKPYRALFDKVEKLHNAYYYLLIDSMGIEGKIVDTDGD